MKMTLYRLAILFALIVPALVCQTVFPFISLSQWEVAAENIYREIMAFNPPRFSSGSRIVIAEADQDTLEKYGWPIERERYIDMLSNLASHGRPWILSFLNFQAKPGPLEKADRDFADAIRTYGRYIGTSLILDQDEQLESDDLRLLRRTFVSDSSSEIDDVILPIGLRERREYIDAEAKDGFISFTQLPVTCVPMYQVFRSPPHYLVLPSSFVWSAVSSSRSAFTMTDVISWSPDQSQTTGRSIRFAPKHCLNSTGISTNDYLDGWKINKISLSKLFENSTGFDFSDKTVVLGSWDLAKLPGPGGPRTERLTNTHHLAARILNDIDKNLSVRRYPLSDSNALAWLPILIAILFLAGSFFVRPLWLVVSEGLLLVTLIGGVWFGATALELFMVPAQSMVSLAASLVFTLALYITVSYRGISRHLRFTDRLRRGLAGCNDLDAIERASSQILAHEFPESSCSLVRFDEELYKTIAVPEALVTLSQHAKQILQSIDSAATGTMVTTWKRNSPVRKRRGFSDSRQEQISMSIRGKWGDLGKIEISLTYPVWRGPYIDWLLHSLDSELSLHWQRIVMLARQKLRDYQILIEKSRSAILRKFLTEHLVSRFDDDLSMDQNLNRILTPRVVHAALLQADIRGYSKLADAYKPQELVKMLQGYFRKVVDHASIIAQVKLIGDCIFLFAEDMTYDNVSTTDLVLKIAALLVDETTKRNLENGPRGILPVNFGIAVHYGEVTVGNLSSEQCIDYTVIGLNVNLVARIEELTKNEAVRDRVGANGVILSEAAIESLKEHRSCNAKSLALDELGVRVRSFPGITKLAYLTADEMLDMGKKHNITVERYRRLNASKTN